MLFPYCVIDSEKSDAPENGLTEVKFEKSVPMVTYLACFIVCDFEYEEKLTAIHQTKFRVYATSNQKERMKYALDIGANITDYFEDYFEIPYPLPKQDMIAIPDFVSGAMEHWGLITYRETNLLFDELESSPGNQQRFVVIQKIILFLKNLIHIFYVKLTVFILHFYPGSPQ